MSIRKRKWEGNGSIFSHTPASSHATVSKHFEREIRPNISEKPFWFPLLDVPATFRDAFISASTALSANDSENAVYHTRFRMAWSQSFPDHCPVHSNGQISDSRLCPACVTFQQEQPVYHYAADSSPIGFESERPDFLVFREVVDKMNGFGCDGVVEIKIKERTSFRPPDISQAVRYGHLVLDCQTLRDQVTICLCSLESVQFVRVFRHNPEIDLSPFTGVAFDGLQQLYSYLPATHADHGQRRIDIQG